MLPWEREVYVQMLVDYIEEENNRNKTTTSLDNMGFTTTTSTTTSTLQLSTNEYCSHDGCSYHAITRKPLCIFHIGTEETKFDTLKRSLNKLPPNPSVQQLEDKATQLEEELQDVKQQIEIAKEREEREAQEEIARQLIIGTNNVQEGEETNVITTLDTIVGTTKKTLKMTPGYRQCRIEGCTNYAIRGGICVRHGAPGKKPCAIEGKFCFYIHCHSICCFFCIQFIQFCSYFCTHIIYINDFLIKRLYKSKCQGWDMRTSRSTSQIMFDRGMHELRPTGWVMQQTRCICIREAL